MSSQPPFTPLLLSPLGLLCILTRFTGEKHQHCTKMKNQESVWALPRPLVVHREHKQAGAVWPCAGWGTKSPAPGEVEMEKP